MSKFFKALEQAEHDRLLRQGQPRREGPEANPAAPSTAGAERLPPAAPVQIESEMEPVPAGSHPAGERTRVTRPGLPRSASSPVVPLNGSDESDGDAGFDDRLVSLLTPQAFEAEQYRGLRHTVEQVHKRSGLSVVAISSPGVGDGKTTTAINLAGALAQTPDVRVLLVDADLRRPSIASRLGIVGPAAPTLADLVLDPILSLDDVTCYQAPFNVTVIPAGSASTNSYELFKAQRFGEILAQARSRFDYIILDTSPLVHVLDARVLSRWVDGYLIVVTCHRTSRKLLAEALNVMEPEKVVGLVFNGNDRPLSGFRDYDYAYTRRRSDPKTSHLARILQRSRRRL
jgi:protein-tyrosine kinase